MSEKPLLKRRRDLDYQEINNELFKQLPQQQVERVFSQDMADIEPSFLGFVEIYYHLSQIIPNHFTVIDLGCAYNPQCFLFENHKKYIAVDESTKTKRFKSSNCKIYSISIQKYIEKHITDLDLDETFAICSYVPSSEAVKLARETFKNIFVYYPHGGHPELSAFFKRHNL